jgi:antitoxin HicB
MLTYLVEVSPDGDRWMAVFPDIPEALTGGATREEVLERAQDALETAMDFYFEDRRAVPLPSAVPKGSTSITLPASVSAKILLLNEMVRQKMRPAELARRLDVRPQDVSRLVNLHHPTKIDTIGDALAVMGKKLVIKIAAA